MRQNIKFHIEGHKVTVDNIEDDGQKRGIQGKY